jgi:hypothetical protein
MADLPVALAGPGPLCVLGACNAQQVKLLLYQVFKENSLLLHEKKIAERKFLVLTEENKRLKRELSRSKSQELLTELVSS